MTALEIRASSRANRDARPIVTCTAWQLRCDTRHDVTTATAILASREGRILWVMDPGPNYVGGPPRPLCYIVDAGQGVPVTLYQSDIRGRINEE